MEISISEEQSDLLKLAENLAGNPLSTFFIHTGEEVKCFQFQFCSDVDSLRRAALEEARANSKTILAYVLAYNSTIKVEGKTIDALILESGDEEDPKAIEFAVPYHRDEGASDSIRFVAKLTNPIYCP